MPCFRLNPAAVVVCHLSVAICSFAVAGGAEVIIRLNPAQYMDVLLGGVHLEDARLPDGASAADMLQGISKFSNVPAGRYVITVSPSVDSFGRQCVCYLPVVVGEAALDVSLLVPSGRLRATVTFPGRPPSFPRYSRIPLRVEKLGADGLDPYYLQWLWVTKEKPFSGGLSHLDMGTFRITAFEQSLEKPGRWVTTPLYSCDVNVGREELEGGIMTIEMQPVEGAD